MINLMAFFWQDDGSGEDNVTLHGFQWIDKPLYSLMTGLPAGFEIFQSREIEKNTIRQQSQFEALIFLFPFALRCFSNIIASAYNVMW